MKPARLRFITMGFVSALILYIASYTIDTACGGYWGTAERDGRDKYTFGLSIPTAILWQPYFGYNAKFNSDFIGNLYSPLVAIDRFKWHRTKYVTDQSTFEWLNHEATISDFHPSFRDEFNKTKQKILTSGS